MLTNGFGRAVFKHLQAGVAPDEAADALAVEFDITASQAGRAITQVQTAWQSAGLNEPRALPFHAPVACRKLRRPHSQVFSLAARQVLMRCENPLISAQINDLLGDYRCEIPTKPTDTIDVLASAQGWGVFVNQTPMWGECSEDFARYLCIRAILEQLCDPTRIGALLHAGAVVKDGRALIIAGPSGAGKSTLALELALGGCALAADDHVALHRDGSNMIAFPGKSSIKKGAWALKPIKALRTTGGGAQSHRDG
ncbi:MAG: hypothetical protein ACC634_05450, partial [Hyphomicrobiales bacterium]